MNRSSEISSKWLVLRSGGWDGHYRTFTSFWCYQPQLDLDLCFGFYSWWNVPADEWKLSSSTFCVMPPILLCLCSSHRTYTPKHQWPASVFHCGNGVLFIIGPIDSFTNVVFIVVAKKVPFWSHCSKFLWSRSFEARLCVVWNKWAALCHLRCNGFLLVTQPCSPFSLKWLLTVHLFENSEQGGRMDHKTYGSDQFLDQ